MWSCLFPGQGSQHPGMGQFLFENFKSTKELFEEASDTIKIDFKKLCFEGPAEELALTHNTQPALLLVSTASYQAVKETAGIEFKYGAGHSVGEYAALVAAGSLKFSDAIAAVRRRGEYMQEAVPVGEGGMVAVMGLEPEQVVQMCEWTEKESGFSPIEPANFNAPGQIVCSGSQKAINWLKDNLNKDIFNPAPKRLKLIPLKVSAPFHCSMMKPAEEKMASFLSDIAFSNPNFSIVQNVTAAPVDEADLLKKNIISQISSPVRWIESVEYLVKNNISQAIELGSGQVISGLCKKIAGDQLQVHGLNSLDDLKKIETMKV